MKSGIKITKAEYAGDYKIKITFNDGHVNIFNYNSMVKFNHEEFSPYLDIKKFKRFKLIMGKTSIGWGDSWAMMIQLETLYSKTRINPKCYFPPKPYLKKIKPITDPKIFMKKFYKKHRKLMSKLAWE